ncbi:MAG: S1C family serine protease, partial [Clostridia bacterium]|nr:S1C family serine protease [Clostridia bacterium]
EFIMKKITKLFLCVATAAAVSCTALFTACSFSSDSGDGDTGTTTQETAVYVTGITASSTSANTFIVTYSNGSTSEFTVESGETSDSSGDSSSGLSSSGTSSLTLQDIYEAYLEEEGLTSDDYSYSDFLTAYLTYNDNSTTVDNSSTNTVTTTDAKYTVAENLLSVATVYASSTITTTTTTNTGGMGGWGGWGGGTTTTTTYDREVYTGSAVIYEITDDSVYFVTCYHVVYCETLEAVANESIYVYLYGSEYDVEQTSEKDTYGYLYDYGDTAIECEFVGGSWAEDVAVLKADKDDVFAINDAVREVQFATDYSVGSTAITIGNYAGEGISATKGSVSVYSEEIDLTLGSTTNTFRVMRLDVDVYSGNSGGGLFDSNGYYIGMVNAMDKFFETSSSGYLFYDYGFAIPVQVVKNSIANIMYYYENAAEGGTYASGKMYTASLGAEVEASSSKYVYDEQSLTGSIVETVEITSLTSGSAADTMGLQIGDVITAITIDGVNYAINNTYDIDDLELIIFEGTVVTVSYERSGTSYKSAEYTFTADDISLH